MTNCQRDVDMTQIEKVIFNFTAQINKIQEYLDSLNVDIPYKRTFVAYLGGLIRVPTYNKVRKQALNAGADELIIEALDRFATQDEMAIKLWKAYCYTNYYNRSIEESVTRFNVPKDQLQTMIDANAPGLFFEYVSWPKDI